MPLTDYRFAQAESVPLLSGLLSLPLDDRYPPLTLSPEEQRDRTPELLVAILTELASHEPVLLVVEDLHWADPSALALVDQLVNEAPTAQFLAVFSSGPSSSLRGAADPTIGQSRSTGWAADPRSRW